MRALGITMLLVSIPAFAFGLYGLHRLALWLEARGLLYYRNKRSEGSGSGVLGVLQDIYEPACQLVRHAKDEKRVRLGRTIGCGLDEPPMTFLEITLPTLEENLALDEALLLNAETGRGSETLRVWEWPTPAVVLGAGCRLAEDVDEAACLADGVPILRRSSGGGTVLLSKGCLLFSLILSYGRSPLLREIRSSYCYILGRMRDALADLLPEMACAGTSDLAAAGLKFSGNAQQRKRNYLLHHGTLLYDFPIGLMHRYLRPPTRQPEYRAGRDHDQFVRNLSCNSNELRRRLVLAWNDGVASADWPRESVDRLTAEKYGNANWTRRR